ncbi:MAG: site-2 protease family protein [Patescibacteria group bacterium]
MVKDKIKAVCEFAVAILLMLVLSLLLMLGVILIIGMETTFNAYNFYKNDFWFAVIIYFCLASVVEMIIHEYGHYYFQRKFGVMITIFRIGVFNLFSKKLKTGTRFIIGIPAFAAESRALGELDDREKEKNNPQSFYYIHRHPKERLIISLAGIGLTLAVCAFILFSYFIQAEFFEAPVPVYLYIMIYMTVATQVTNLIPCKFGKFSTDSWIAIESIRDWIKFKKSSV